MRYFGLFTNNGDGQQIEKVQASDIHDAQMYFCMKKGLSLYDLLIIFYVKEIE